MPYVKKMIYSGKLLEIENYPVSQKGNRIRTTKSNTSSNSQANLNEKNALKHLIRLVETNYTEDDMFITLSYKVAPESSAKLKKDFQNFLRRLKFCVIHIPLLTLSTSCAVPSAAMKSPVVKNTGPAMAAWSA